MSKVYFITGASSGFGEALARAVLERGDRAVLAARRVAALNAIVGDYGEHAMAVRLDVTDATQRRYAVEQALDRFGRVDVLANIAGIGSLGAAEEFSPAQLRQQMEVNFFAPAELTRALLPMFRAQGSGHILQLTSIGGSVSAAGFSAYCAAKFALEGWSEALRDELAPLGIHVIIVEPGAFRTEFAGDKNMRPVNRIDAYRAIIEPVETYLYGGSGSQPGDPAKAAEVMVAAVESATPPLRLVLGADSYSAWESKIAMVRADLDAWRTQGLATAFEGAEVKPVGGG
jgi:NAD(P)-dependent dehydrogenase (short-subunit alcohol dehydrogenase family)